MVLSDRDAGWCSVSVKSINSFSIQTVSIQWRKTLGFELSRYINYGIMMGLGARLVGLSSRGINRRYRAEHRK